VLFHENRLIVFVANLFRVFFPICFKWFVVCFCLPVRPCFHLFVRLRASFFCLFVCVCVCLVGCLFIVLVHSCC
jgi:hypothetical protein